MSEQLVQKFFAERIGGVNFGKDDTVYKFEKIKRAKRAAVKEHPDIELIDLGVGEPDGMTPQPVVEALALEAARHENRGYTDNGIMEFREAVVWHMGEVYGVSGLDPESQVNHSIGSKSALAIMPAALVDPGDLVLMTVPGYPVFGTHSKWLGAEVKNLPLLEANGFLPDLESVSEEDARRAKVLVINYPNNPTGTAANEEFFKQVVDWAHKYEVAIVQDAAYASLVYGRKPMSILSIDGAMDVAVELHSLSKSHNMTGWRIGWVTGNSGLVKAFAEVKDHSDSGQFAAIQKAAAVGLRDPEMTRRIAEKYERKLKLLCNAFNDMGFSAKLPDGTFFMFMRSPKGIEGERQFASAEECSQWLIREHLISTVPEDTVDGGYLRASATFLARDEEDEKRIAREIGNRLGGSKFVF
jgi:LL-diaminopimelate aminotransferase